jgi:hypothetical protein
MVPSPRLEQFNDQFTVVGGKNEAQVISPVIWAFCHLWCVGSKSLCSRLQQEIPTHRCDGRAQRPAHYSLWANSHVEITPQEIDRIAGVLAQELRTVRQLPVPLTQEASA